MAQAVLAVVLEGSDTAAGFARRLARTGFEADLLLAGPTSPPRGSWRRAWRRGSRGTTRSRSTFTEA